MGDWRSFDIANPTEEHAMIREMVRDFVKEEVEPQALEYDRDEKFNLDLFRKLGDYGLLGITVAEEYGANGCDRCCHCQRGIILFRSGILSCLPCSFAIDSEQLGIQWFR